MTETQIAELGRVKETESGEPRRLAVYQAALVALPRVLEERKRLLDAIGVAEGLLGAGEPVPHAVLTQMRQAIFFAHEKTP